MGRDEFSSVVELLALVVVTTPAIIAAVSSLLNRGKIKDLTRDVQQINNSRNASQAALEILTRKAHRAGVVSADSKARRESKKEAEQE